MTTWIRLEGDVPSPVNPPSGCRFRTRCWKAQEICVNEEPPLLQVGGRQVACHFAEPMQVVAAEEGDIAAQVDEGAADAPHLEVR